jgi:hypothetical protein
VRVIATRGDGIYLLMTDEERNLGRVLHTDPPRLFQEMSIDAILKFGLWESASMPDAELQEFVMAATAIQPGDTQFGQ